MRQQASPDMLLLGEDVSPQTSVWILWGRLETALKIIRENTEREMLRRKKYLDTKVAWSTYEPAEKV